MSGCVRCDWHGPDLPGIEAGARAAHRAWHDLCRAVEVELTPWLERMLTAADRTWPVLPRGARWWR